ncbi:MAG: Uma2 family endonuclease [Leptolyngbyaceae cyanobacterium]
MEIVSINWRDDYDQKRSDYEAMGVSEYWIVDYLDLGGRRYLGVPKRPTVTVGNLIDGEYQIQQFCRSDRLVSQIFPELQLEIDRVFDAGA